MESSLVSVSAETHLSKYYMQNTHSRARTHTQTHTAQLRNQIHVKWELALPCHCKWSDNDSVLTEVSVKRDTRRTTAGLQSLTHKVFSNSSVTEGVVYLQPVLRLTQFNILTE